MPTVSSSRVCQDAEIPALALPGQLHQARHGLSPLEERLGREMPTGPCPCRALRIL